MVVDAVGALPITPLPADVPLLQLLLVLAAPSPESCYLPNASPTNHLASRWDWLCGAIYTPELPVGSGWTKPPAEAISLLSTFPCCFLLSSCPFYWEQPPYPYISWTRIPILDFTSKEPDLRESWGWGGVGHLRIIPNLNTHQNYTGSLINTASKALHPKILIQ